LAKDKEIGEWKQANFVEIVAIEMMAFAPKNCIVTKYIAGVSGRNKM
jgi:hypothetical protein